MFKKLKDKIVEEAKNSPQRFQQITQSVSDKLQSSTVEENLFSIDDDVDSRPSVSTTPIQSNVGGFTSVSLHTSTPVVEPRQRRTSNSSLASDVSFLPRYEPGNMYHLQSDIEASASEMEDNVSNSSTQTGHISKEQVYAELQRVRLRYHKYRGRYTDLANHYKDLERENGKMKAVLVETQDISIRRIGELREQCQLEQKAKAHLENALRVEIDERQYIIDTLKTKIELLNSSNASEIVFEADNANGILTNGNSTSPLSPEYTQLSTDLANAKTEIATLSERLQELKASKIISQTKEANLLSRINDLESEMTKNTQNNSKLANLIQLESEVAKMADLETKLLKMADLENKMSKMKDLEDKQEARITELVEEKEKIETGRLKQKISEEEHNIQLARHKMTVHTELQNKDLEINNLKSDLETLKDELESYEKDTAPKSAADKTRMDNLQGQNTKLIDKVELLTAKCNNMEAELLKMEQVRQENRNLIENANNLKEVNKGFTGDLNQLKYDLGVVSEALQVSRNDVILLSEEKTDLQQQLENVIKSNASLNEKYSNLNMEHNDLDDKYNKLLIDNTSLSDSLIAKNKELEKIRSDAKSSLLTLERRITKKLQHKFDQRSEKMSKEYEEKINKLSVNDENVKEVHVKLLAREDSIKTLQDDLANINDELTISRRKYDELEANYLELIEENRDNIADKLKVQSEKNLVEKNLENDQVVVQQLTEQLESNYLEVIWLKDRLEVSISNESTLEEKIKQLEQTLQDKDDYIAEETNKISRDGNNITFLEERLKLKDGDLKILADDCNRKLIQRQDEFDCLKTDFKTLQDELNTAKTNNEILITTLVANDNEIADLKNKMANEEVAATNLNDTIISLNKKIDMLSKQGERINQQKLAASKQVQKLIEEKLLMQSQLNNIIIDIKVEFDNVQAENNSYKTRIEELNVIKTNSDEVQLKNSNLLEENRRLNVKIDDISKETAEEVLNLRSTLDDSNKQSGELVKLTAKKVELVKEVSDLNKIVDNLTADQKRHKQQIVALQIAKEEMAQAIEDKNKCLQEISDLKGNLQRLVNDRQHLEQQASQSHDIQRQNSAITSELTAEREKTARLNDELSLVTVRNRQLAEDRDRLIEDSDRLVVEVEQARLMAEEGQKGKTDQTTQQDAQIARFTSELTAAQAQIATLTAQLESSVASVTAIQLDSHLPNTENFECTLQEKITELAEMTRRFEMILEENRAVKEDLVEVARLREEVEGERRRLELMVGDMDRSYSEMKHENQLLKDEIQELKITPMNLNTSSKQANSNLLNGTNNNTTTSEITDSTKEMEQLREKVQQYKAIDATNRTSIEFYELELDRTRARGDKLERRLDETLVTLRHCAELSGVDTQVEYLRHVLYNYMLGREGVVLARVIAAVCKFDSVQTEAVLKHEQQKQTLLGQLGIL